MGYWKHNGNYDLYSYATQKRVKRFRVNVCKLQSKTFKRGVQIGDSIGDYCRIMKGDARSLDNSSCRTLGFKGLRVSVFRV